MRLHLCDDHAVFEEGLSVVLRSRGHVVTGCSTHPADAVAAVERDPVDIVLLDLQFPEGSAIPIIPELLAVPGTRVVVLTASDDAMLLGQAVAAGASGIVSKGDDVSRILDVLERVQTGEVVLNERALRAAVGGGAHAARTPTQLLASFLTEREREVLGRLVQGESGAVLAKNMGLRYSTARTHIQNVLNKLGVHSMLEAVALAVSHDLVDVPKRDT